MWRSVGFLMSFAVVLEGMTLIAYLVIMLGGKQKREQGWKVLSGCLACVAAVQCAGMAIIVSGIFFLGRVLFWMEPGGAGGVLLGLLFVGWTVGWGFGMGAGGEAGMGSASAGFVGLIARWQRLICTITTTASSPAGASIPHGSCARLAGA